MGPQLDLNSSHISPTMVEKKKFCGQNVLHVPHLKPQLISLQKLVKERPSNFVLDIDGCFLYDKVVVREMVDPCISTREPMLDST